jgi:hypothetical protein
MKAEIRYTLLAVLNILQPAVPYTPRTSPSERFFHRGPNSFRFEAVALTTWRQSNARSRDKAADI